MAQTWEFYAERARESAVEATAAKLDNVRDRALRSQATWLGLADQARRVAEERVKVERERVERRDAETGDAETGDAETGDSETGDAESADAEDLTVSCE